MREDFCNLLIQLNRNLMVKCNLLINNDGQSVFWLGIEKFDVFHLISHKNAFILIRDLNNLLCRVNQELHWFSHLKTAHNKSKLSRDVVRI